jgi:hypothetical protein
MEEKFSWTDRVRNEVWQRVKEERKILQTVKTRKGNWNGLILGMNWLLKHVTEGKTEGRIEVTGKRVRRRKQLRDDLNENTGYSTLWRTRCGRGRQRKEWTVKHLKYKNRTVYWFLYVRFTLSRYHYFVQDACLFLSVDEVRFQFDVKSKLHWADITESSLLDVQRGHNIQISP